VRTSPSAGTACRWRLGGSGWWRGCEGGSWSVLPLDASPKRSLTLPTSGPICPDAVITCQRPPTEPGADRGEAGLMALRQIPHELPLPRHLGQAFPVQAEQLMKNHALPSFEAHALRQETVPPTNRQEFCGRPEQHNHELFLCLGVLPRWHDPWSNKKR
jgi:hypothetical protein